VLRQVDERDDLTVLAADPDTRRARIARGRLLLAGVHELSLDVPVGDELEEHLADPDLIVTQLLYRLARNARCSPHLKASSASPTCSAPAPRRWSWARRHRATGARRRRPLEPRLEWAAEAARAYEAQHGPYRGGVQRRVGRLPQRTTLGTLVRQGRVRKHRGYRVEMHEVTKNNVVRHESFAERLDEVMRRYMLQQLTSAQVIAELAAPAREVAAEARRGERFDPPLSHAELAFYDAIGHRDMATLIAGGDDTLAKITRTLVADIRKNLSVTGSPANRSAPSCARASGACWRSSTSRRRRTARPSTW
jgi:restriction endonuclease HindI-like protein